MAGELKPCPFCGGKPSLWWRKDRYTSYIRAECGTCGAKTRGVTTAEDPDDPDFWDCSDAKLAVERWNRRDRR